MRDFADFPKLDGLIADHHQQTGQRRHGNLADERAKEQDNDGGKDARKAVSYTHLTLPTSDLVEISVVAVSLKKKT